MKIYLVGNCKNCPNCFTERTQGAGYALDYFFKAAEKKKIVGYVEWNSDGPFDGKFPDFCPLKTRKVVSVPTPKKPV